MSDDGDGGMETEIESLYESFDAKYEIKNWASSYCAVRISGRHRTT